MSMLLFFLFLIFNFNCYTYVMREGKPKAAAYPTCLSINLSNAKYPLQNISCLKHQKRNTGHP